MYAKNFKHYFHIPKAKSSSKAHYCWAKIQYLEFWLRIEFLLKENMGKGGTNDLKCLNFQVFSLAELLLQQFCALQVLVYGEENLQKGIIASHLHCW